MVIGGINQPDPICFFHRGHEEMQRVLFGDTSVVNLCISACVKAGNDSLKMGWKNMENPT